MHNHASECRGALYKGHITTVDTDGVYPASVENHVSNTIQNHLFQKLVKSKYTTSLFMARYP